MKISAEDLRSDSPPNAVRFTAERGLVRATEAVPEHLRYLDPPKKVVHTIDRVSLDGVAAEPIAPFRPPWADASFEPLYVEPPKSPERKLMHRGREIEPAIVHHPDDRRLYDVPEYPWQCLCQIVDGRKVGSGAIVGPRHILTASHVIDWSSDRAIRVEVFLVGSTPLTTTFSTDVYFYTEVSPSIPHDDVDEDYAVIVTRDRVGDRFGWLGVRTYNSSGDGEPFWWNISYPSDIGNGDQPTFQRDRRLDEDELDLGGGRAMSTDADMVKRQSGGPMLSFWDGDPYVVSVMSGFDDDTNWCAGGNDLTRLVNQARAEMP